MAYPRSDRTYTLMVNKSTGTDQVEEGMGAILCQIDKNGTFHAIRYASKQLIKHEKNYSPSLLENGCNGMADGVLPRTPKRQKAYPVHRSQNPGNFGYAAHQNHEQATTGHDGL
jgi:hypothetical protein